MTNWLPSYASELREMLQRSSLFARGRLRPVNLGDITFDLPSELTMDVEIRDRNFGTWRLFAAGGLEPRLSPELDNALRGDAGERTLHVLNQLAREATIEFVAPEQPREAEIWKLLLGQLPWEKGNKKKLLVVPLSALILSLQRSVLTGPPGGGKSTVLRQAALRALDTFEQHGAKQKPKLPVFIEIRRLGALFATGKPPSFEDLLDAYSNVHFEGSYESEIRCALTERFRAGTLRIFIDGLDETWTHLNNIRTANDDASNEDFLRQVMGSGNFVAASSRHSVRVAGSHSPVELAIGHITAADAIHIASSASDLLMPSEDDRRLRHERIEALVNATDPQLTRRPLYLSIIGSYVSDHREYRHPSRAALLAYMTNILLEEWVSAKIDDKDVRTLIGCEAKHVRPLLNPIAWRGMQAAIEQRTTAGSVTATNVNDTLMETHIEADPRTIKRYLLGVAGIFFRMGDDRYEFSHRQIQEYLVADHFAGLLDLGHSAEEALDAFARAPQFMEEPLLLMGQCLEDQHRSPRIWDFVATALDSLQIVDSEEYPTRSALIHICARLLRNFDAGELRSSRNAGVTQALTAEIRAILSKPTPLPGQLKLDIADFLGAAGDPRPGLGMTPGGVPDISWCTVDHGRARIGIRDEDRAMLADLAGGDDRLVGIGRESPSWEFEFAPFRIARFPVTRLQFAAFVQEAYDEERFWQDLVHSDRRSPEWIEELRQEHPNRPIAEVDWWEANAFARWMSDKLGRTCRLPYEAEWEAAARGRESLLFPYPEGFVPDCANWHGLQLGSTSPVGLYPGEGRMPPGLPEDMLGNVWEWCLDLAAEESGAMHPYPLADPRAPVRLDDRSTMRVVRGGSYTNHLGLLRLTYRGRDYPASRFLRQGFRLLCEDIL